MILVISVHLFVVLSLLWVISRKGVEGALPLALCFIVIFPEESKLPVFGVFDLTVQRLVTLVLLAATLLSKPSTSPPPRRGVPLSRGLIFVTLCWVLATANSIDFSASLKALLSLLLDYLTIYVIFAKRVTSEATVEKVFGGMVDGLIIVSVFGVLEAYQNWSVVSLFPTMAHRFGESGSLYMDEARGLRIQATFGHPILFGSALAMGIPVALHLLTRHQSRLRRIWLWIGLMLMLLCIFKTSSRGPWIALIASFVLCFFFGEGKMRRYVGTLLVVAALAMVVRPGVWETIVNDYGATMDEHSSQGESYIYRFALYQLVIEKVGDSPARALVGYGPQSFPSLHLSGFIHERWMNFVSCDSSFAALLAETGYVGLVAMSLLLFRPLLFAVRTFRKIDRSQRQVCLILCINLAIFLFQMTNVAILGWGQQTIVLWVVIAITMTYPEICRPEEEPEHPEARLGLEGMGIPELVTTA